MKQTIDGAWVEDVDGRELGRVGRHDAAVIEVITPEGRRIELPPSALGTIEGRARRLRLMQPLASLTGHEVRIPVATEDVHVSKQTVEGDRVRVTVRTHTEERVIDPIELQRESLEVDRVAVGREVAAAPTTREEGDVLVIPVVEEVLVVRKALVLREEIRVRRRRHVERRPAEPMSVRVERAEVERPSHA